MGQPRFDRLSDHGGIAPTNHSESINPKERTVSQRLTCLSSSDTIGGMGKVGKALRHVLESYGISQNKLAVTLGVKPSVVFRWFHEQTDPSGETIADIAEALQGMNPSAAEEFVRLYLGKYLSE
ncbi:MAG TPA: helix-turn-helix transcriptional regulator [Cyanophyceae cyanobacterium]